jgi:hypothetical protein
MPASVNHPPDKVGYPASNAGRMVRSPGKVDQTMRKLFFAATCAVIALLAIDTAWAGEPRYGQAAFSMPDSKSAQLVFKPDTPKIVLHVELLDVPKGTTLAADWIAEKTEVAPANYKIDSAETAAGKSDEVEFTLSKPNTGWPTGDYRVELSIDGEHAKTVRFQVAQ